MRIDHGFSWFWIQVYNDPQMSSIQSIEDYSHFIYSFRRVETVSPNCFDLLRPAEPVSRGDGPLDDI